MLMFTKMKYLKLSIFILTLLKYCCPLQTPCPKYFVYEPEKSQEDRWYGLITLNSRIYTKGVTLEFHFDKSVIQFGNFFGAVTSNSENTKFTISNANKEVQADVSVQEEIFVIYDPYDRENPEPPNIVKILLNGREICPHYQEQNTRDPNFNKSSVVVNMNVSTCGITIVTGLPLITEGQHTVPGQWPWHVGIYKRNGNKREYYCGGSLISERYILTAAHCMVDGGNKPLASDEVLIILGTAVGWGRDSKNNALSDLLMQAQMPVVDQLTCIYSNRDFYSQFTNDRNFCAGFRNGTSVCNGDSGGGLYFQKKNSSSTKPVWMLRGIVSNTVPKEGFVCDPTYYVIFTDVAQYLDWIKQNTNN